MHEYKALSELHINCHILGGRCTACPGMPEICQNKEVFSIPTMDIVFILCMFNQVSQLVSQSVI